MEKDQWPVPLILLNLKIIQKRCKDTTYYGNSQTFWRKRSMTCPLDPHWYYSPYPRYPRCLSPWLWLRQVFAIGFTSVQVIVGHRSSCAKQTKHYVRDFFFSCHDWKVWYRLQRYVFFEYNTQSHGKSDYAKWIIQITLCKFIQNALCKLHYAKWIMHFE